MYEDDKKEVHPCLGALGSIVLWFIAFSALCFSIWVFLEVNQFVGFILGAFVLYMIFSGNSDKKDSNASQQTYKYSKTSPSGYPSNWDEIRAQVLKRDGYKCCNDPTHTGKLHVHHIYPLSKGGSNRLSNLQTMCEKCHEDLHPHMK